MQLKPQIRYQGMSRLFALFLLVLFVAPWLLVFTAPDAITEASLPACCRVHGKHKCFMRLPGSANAASGRASFFWRAERCPYNPVCATAPHGQFFGQRTTDVSIIRFADASISEAVATWVYTSCTSLANCKRGPPSPVLSLATTTDWPAAHLRLPLRWRQNVSIKTDISYFRPGASPDSARSS
jgi:hypothetical protein